MGRGGLRAERAQTALSVILKLVTCGLTSIMLIKYCSFSVPESVFPGFFEAKSQNHGSSCHGYGLVIMSFTSSTCWGFSICKTAQRTWLNFICRPCATCVLSHFSSVIQSCLTLCDPMNLSTPGLPVHYQLSRSTQTHVHGVRDAIQPSHPLSSPSPPAPNPSQHQGLFQRVNSLHEVAKVLEFQL